MYDQARLMQRSQDGVRPAAMEGGVLQGLAASEAESLADEAVALRKALRIKVEDDNDLITARRAFAECGYFLVALNERAAATSVTATALLRRLERGEGD